MMDVGSRSVPSGAFHSLDRALTPRNSKSTPPQELSLLHGATGQVHYIGKNNARRA